MAKDTELGRKHIVVLVLNEFHNDARVNRAARFLSGLFGRTTVICGVTQASFQRCEQVGRTFVIRYSFFKPTYGASGVTQWATRVATAQGSQSKTRQLLGVRQWARSLIRPTLFLGWFLYLLALNLKMAVQFSRVAADGYCANDLDTLLAGYLLSRLHHSRLIYDAHELYPDVLPTAPQLYRRLFMKLEQHLVRRADAIITVNDSIARVMRDRYHLKSLPLVVRNCPPLSLLRAKPLAEKSERGRMRVLFHGMYHPARNLSQLVGAMSYVTEQVELYFRGFGSVEGHLRQQVQELGLEDKVQFLGPYPMVEAVNQATEFDVGIVPYPGSREQLNSFYCSPNKIYEYLMAGLALAVSDLPELRRIVDKWECGVTFSPDDPRDIARALNELARDPQRLRQMQANALQAAREEYNFEHESKKLQKIVEEVFSNE